MTVPSHPFQVYIDPHTNEMTVELGPPIYPPLPQEAP
jgi:hypothetical protein